MPGVAAWFRKDYLTESATWNDKRVVVGGRDKLPHAGFTRTEAGRWKGGWKGDEANEFEVLGDRIRSAGVVSVTRTPQWRLALGGEVARIENPPWPEIAFAFLCLGWGVSPSPLPEL